MRKEIEKLDEEFYDNIEVIGVNGCLHRRDAKLLELVQVEIRKKYVSSLGFGMVSWNEALDKVIGIIDKLKGGKSE
jgi:hypothetical protein